MSEQGPTEEQIENACQDFEAVNDPSYTGYFAKGNILAAAYRRERERAEMNGRAALALEQRYEEISDQLLKERAAHQATSARLAELEAKLAESEARAGEMHRLLSGPIMHGEGVLPCGGPGACQIHDALAAYRKAR